MVLTGAVSELRGEAAWEIAVDVELVRIHNPSEEAELEAWLLGMDELLP